MQLVQCQAALKTYKQETLYGLSRLYLRIYTYIGIYVHALTINSKEVNNLKESWEGYMGGDSLEGGMVRYQCCN